MTSTAITGTGDPTADQRARATEAKMTDDERFSMITSVMGADPVAPVRAPASRGPSRLSITPQGVRSSVTRRSPIGRATIRKIKIQEKVWPDLRR
jgi:hypothetical protein